MMLKKELQMNRITLAKVPFRGFRGFVSSTLYRICNAALIAWKLIVIMAINNATTVVITKTGQLIFLRYAKSSSHVSLPTTQSVKQ